MGAKIKRLVWKMRFFCLFSNAHISIVSFLTMGIRLSFNFGTVIAKFEILTWKKWEKVWGSHFRLIFLAVKILLKFILWSGKIVLKSLPLGWYLKIINYQYILEILFQLKKTHSFKKRTQKKMFKMSISWVIILREDTTGTPIPFILILFEFFIPIYYI